MVDREKPSSLQGLNQQLDEYLMLDKVGVLAVGFGNVTFDNKDTQIVTRGLDANANLTEKATFAKWATKLYHASIPVALVDLHTHLEASFVSKPCQEFIILEKFEALHKEEEISPLVRGVLKADDRTSGGIFDITLARDIDQGLLYIATQKGMQTFQLASHLGLVDVAQALGITIDNSRDLIGRWRSELMNRDGGFA